MERKLKGNFTFKSNKVPFLPLPVVLDLILSALHRFLLH